MTSRVVLGAYGDGTFGLKVSLPGYDALTDDASDSAKFSFNSEWTNLVKVHQIGLCGIRYLFYASPIYYTELGYIPFIELRRKDGVNYYDDRNVNNGSFYTTELKFTTYADRFLPYSAYQDSGYGAYVIYKENSGQ